MIYMNYIYFIIFCVIMVFSPGPMTMLLMSISAENGLKKTMPAQFGASSAYFISLLFFAIGLTSILQSYSMLLKIIQYIGVCYILYLAWKQWQNSKISQATDCDKNNTGVLISANKLYWRGLITGLSNPKTIIMFSTVIPKFTQNNSSQVKDIVILSVIFLVLQFLSGVTYSYFGYAIKSFLQHEKYRKTMYKGMSITLLMVAIMVFKA